MSNFDGGFVIARADASVAEPIYRVVRAYLERIGEPLTRRSLVYGTGRSPRCLWLSVAGGPSAGRGRFSWHARHADLAGEIGAALSCPTWAWGSEDQSGSEWVIGFDATGTTISERSFVPNDDEDEDEDDSDDDDDDDSASEAYARRPVAELARRLGDWGADESVSTTVQALDQPFAPDVLATYLLALAPSDEMETRPGRVRLSVFLRQKNLADASRLAEACGSDVGTVFWAAWEIAKGNACRMNPGRDGALLRIPRGESPTDLVSPRREAPALNGIEHATPDLVTLFVPKRVEEEVRALAIHADVKYGAVLDYVYGVARRLLWQGRAW